MASFATSNDLESRGVTVADWSVADQLLSDASEALRSIIGCDPYPQRQSTFTIWIGRTDQWIPMPARPVVSIDTVTLNSQDVQWRRVGDSIKVYDHGWPYHGWYSGTEGGGGELTVTFTFGFSTVPQELTAWACVLASQALAMIAELGTLGAGEVSSIGIDDYRKSYKQIADRGAFTLPATVCDMLAANYGMNALVTGTLR